jgi:hypothetical protein
MAIDDKYLTLRGKSYLFKYRIPKHLLPHWKGKNPHTATIPTDSLVQAKQIRDQLLTKIQSCGIPSSYEDTVSNLLAEIEQFTMDNPHLQDAEGDYRSIEIDKILDKPKPDEHDQLHLDALAERRPKSHSGLLYLTNEVAKLKISEGLAPSTIEKLRCATRWYLRCIGKKDVQITEVTKATVASALVHSKHLSGGAKDGHLIYLSAIWDHAVELELVTDSKKPTKKHRYLRDKESYDPYTKAEVYALYRGAGEGSELQRMIAIAMTTGMRFSEILDAEILTSEGIQYWAIKYKSKGKTATSTRTIPIHNSLLAEMDKYRVPIRRGRQSLSHQMKALIDMVITNKVDNRTRQA